MKMRRSLILAAVLTFIATLAAPAASMEAVTPNWASLTGVYTPHAPIQILSDLDFTAPNGVTSGTGTTLDPYHISGWEIDASIAGSAGIDIQGTDAYFIIENVLIRDGKPVAKEGVLLADVANGTVANSSLINNDDGIRLSGTIKTVVANNTLTDNLYGIALLDGSGDNDVLMNRVWSSDSIGIRLVASTSDVSGNRVRGNTINGSGSFGVDLQVVLPYRSSLNNISENLIFGGSYGLRVLRGDNNTIHNNTVRNTGSFGVWLESPCCGTDDTPDNRVLMNTVHDIGWAGIYLGTGVGNIHRSVVHDNVVYNVVQYGIYLQMAHDSDIRRNVVYSTPYGIYLDGSEDNIVDSNRVHNNSDSGIYLGSSLGPTRNNAISRNRVENASNAGIYLNKGFYAIDLNQVAMNQLVDNMNYGVKLSNASNENVSWNVAWRNHHGIHLESSSNNLVRNNIAVYNDVGIHLISRTVNPTILNQVRDNIARWNTEHGIYLDVATPGIGGADVSRNDVLYNTAGNNTMTGIYVYASSANNVSRNDVFGNQDGIYLNTGSTGSTNSNIVGWNRIHDNTASGIYLSRGTGDQTRQNVVTRNTVERHGQSGIALQSADDNSVTFNDIGWNIQGIYVASATGNNISSNRIHNSSSRGGYSSSADDNNYSYNHFADNAQPGFGFGDNSKGNWVYRNNFVNNNGNTSQAWDDTGGLNRWNLSAPIGGNFWSDHSYTCPDSPPDGFCDTPYSISGITVQDHLPLKVPSPVPVPEFGLGAQLALVGLTLALLLGLSRLPERRRSV